MNVTKLLEAIDRCAVMEYGLCPAPVAALLCDKGGCEAVVAALNNADTDGVLLSLLDTKTQKVFDGLEIAAQVTGAKKKILHLPEYAAELAEKLKAEAEKNNVELALGIVNVRANENNFLCHIVTCADMAEAVSGEYTEGVYVSVNGGELKKLPGETTVKELLGDKVKAVRTGYTLRGADALSLTLEDAGIENGVLNAITDTDCVVDTVQKYLLAARAQSCGKCVFCREGLLQLEAMQKDMTVGRGTLTQLDMTKEIGEAMCFSGSCTLGNTAAKLPLSAVDACRGEYEDHIKKHRCAADVCTAFRKYYIEPNACTGCTECMTVCPVDSIDGAKGYIHMVFDNNCVKCGKCVDACPEGAVKLTTGRVPRLPDRMVRVGRFK